jgi:hypothetical protein
MHAKDRALLGKPRFNFLGLEVTEHRHVAITRADDHVTLTDLHHMHGRVLRKHGRFKNGQEPPLSRSNHPSARKAAYNSIKAAEQERDDQKCTDILEPEAGGHCVTT